MPHLIAAGIVPFFAPGAGIVAIAEWPGACALLSGIALLITAFRIRDRPA